MGQPPPERDIDDILRLLGRALETSAHDNVIERSFATVRHRTVRSKGCLSNKTALAMIFKLGEAAERSGLLARLGWRGLSRKTSGSRYRSGPKPPKIRVPPYHVRFTGFHDFWQECELVHSGARNGHPSEFRRESFHDPISAPPAAQTLHGNSCRARASSRPNSS
jgi:hypothetical protein